MTCIVIDAGLESIGVTDRFLYDERAAWQRFATQGSGGHDLPVDQVSSTTIVYDPFVTRLELLADDAGVYPDEPRDWLRREIERRGQAKQQSVDEPSEDRVG
jgi:hypothetical protein